MKHSSIVASLSLIYEFTLPGCTTNHKEKSMIVMIFYRELVHQNYNK